MKPKGNLSQRSSIIYFWNTMRCIYEKEIFFFE